MPAYSPYPSQGHLLSKTHGAGLSPNPSRAPEEDLPCEVRCRIDACVEAFPQVHLGVGSGDADPRFRRHLAKRFESRSRKKPESVVQSMYVLRVSLSEREMEFVERRWDSH